MFTARHNIPPFNVEFHALRLRDEYLPHLKGVKKAICDLDTDSGPELEHGDNLEQELQNVCDELRASLTVVLKWAQAKIEEGKRLGFYDQDHKLLSRWDDCRANELPVATSYSAGNLLAKIVRLKRDYQDSIDVVRQQLHTCIIPGHNADRPNFNNVCASVTELLVKLQGRVMRFEVENHSSHTQPDRQQNHAGVALATLPTLKRKNDEEHASTARGSPAEDAAYPLSFSILAAAALMRVAEPSSSRQQTVSRKKRPKTPVEQLEAPRRPESETYWGRGQVTPEKWEVMTEKTRMRHSHMGRIEETDAGMSPAESCENCSLRRWANCKVYKPEAVGKYVSAEDAWQACSTCRRSGLDTCSFVIDAQEREVAARKAAEPATEEISKNNRIVGARRPTNLRSVMYGNKITDAKWVKMSHRTKLRWSHIGRIEETDAGRVAPEACRVCSGVSFMTCRVYTDEAIGVYTTPQGDCQACSWCRTTNQPCSLARPEILSWPEPAFMFEDYSSLTRRRK